MDFKYLFEIAQFSFSMMKGFGLFEKRTNNFYSFQRSLFCITWRFAFLTSEWELRFGYIAYCSVEQTRNENVKLPKLLPSA